MSGTLFVCATPIGNMDDVTPRLRETLGSVQVIACEDTRRTRSLLSALDIATPRLLSYRLDNEGASARGIVEVLRAGQDVALVTDAGTPGISDPGGVLVREAHVAGVPVIAIVGASSVAAAMSVSGATATGYTFVGFLPRSGADLSHLVSEHSHEVVVALESPRRVAASLETIASVQPQRRVSMSRELTKLHETTLSGDAATIAARAAQAEVRGEVVLVLDALPRERAAIAPRSLDLVHAMIEEGIRMKTACKLVAAHDGVSSGELYDLVLAARTME